MLATSKTTKANLSVKFLRALLLSALCYLSASFHSYAGDYAMRNIIGFTKDGNLFAFEEYGIQDGSGFAYANIYLINTQNDTWTGGSPWRMRIEEDSIDAKQSIANARDKARALSADKLDQITESGFIAATNRHTELPQDPMRIKARPRHFVPSGSQTIEYELVIKPATQSAHCQNLPDIKGFNLFQIINNQKIQLHIDGANIPKSRNCPINYKFADIVTYYSNGPYEALPKVAILILVESFGFEGPDGRYIAITAPVEPQ